MTTEKRYRPYPASLRFEANGIALHFLDWGEGSLRHLVLLHGLASQAHTWDRFANEAADHFRVAALDLRGHGQSDHAKDGYAPGLFVDDVRAFVRYLNIPAVDLIGHSLGALVALRFAAEYPALVNRLVLVDGGPGLDAEVGREGAYRFNRPQGFGTQEEAKAFLLEQNPGHSDEQLDERIRYGMKQNWAGKWVFRYDPELYWILEDVPGWGREDEQRLWDMLATIPCPVLLLRGQESPLLSSEAARRIVRTAPDATLVEIPGAGHSIPSDAPERFRDAVLEFLRG